MEGDYKWHSWAGYLIFAVITLAQKYKKLLKLTHEKVKILCKQGKAIQKI